MNLIEKIQEIETQINNIAELRKKNTFENGEFINGLKVILSGGQGGHVEYTLSFNSQIENQLVELYLLGLKNMLHNYLKEAKKEKEVLEGILKKYE